ncbi:hypothetical protein EV11_1684 [Prochlorococcus sp. SS52]|nr:hypothetical protein EV04_0885 [Prochlorococcus marinus str. LG]KGG21833.1 hypothetical protein EV08_0438 [Prochlorococcus marinus str. SS2]KGG23736.1 hypothetical protein EV09_1361 [Prochlorococcus marinus str. SS35]KGG32028.1 hypothetical protein EV10_1142 [Prochlorococcus marinus str. SS51]KGG35281.1 hypothetical protein EV11_1684 [Prochlorococcus sp. SS52]
MESKEIWKPGQYQSDRKNSTRNEHKGRETINPQLEAFKCFTVTN